MRYGGEMDWRDMGFGGGHIVATLIWLAVVIALIVLVVLAIRWLLRQNQATSGGGVSAPRPDDPLEILRQRYAKGDIDDEEFNRRRTILGG